MEKAGNEQQMSTIAQQTPYLIATNGNYHPLYNEGAQGAPLRMQSGGNKSCCEGAFGQPDQTAKYDENDLYSLKPNVKVDFGEVFQEPEGSEGFAFIWNYNKIIYYWTNRVFYSFLVGVLGPVLAVAWGLIFATMNFLLVWAINPATKIMLQLTRVVEVIVRGVVRAFMDPVFQSFGQMWTFLRGSFSLRVAGLGDAIKPPQYPESRA